MAQMPPTGNPPQSEFRDLKEVLSSYQQEVQKSEALLKRTYDMLDNQAAQTAQECMDRYLLNNTLLAQIFHGPEASHHSPGGTIELSGRKACFRDEVTLEVESIERGSPEGKGKPRSKLDAVDDFVRMANTSVGKAGCHIGYAKGEDEIAGASSERMPHVRHRATKKRKQTMVAPRVRRVELCELEEVLFPMGPDEDTILL